ncbi:protein kinase [Longispora sp. K20-0274]|uniref:protein kinase domain-containing protein n=1 Tax=Longispora sp. K20-0274 TaxID=3088255 RepID=UPI00399B51CA
MDLRPRFRQFLLVALLAAASLVVPTGPAAAFGTAMRIRNVDTGRVIAVAGADLAADGVNLVSAAYVGDWSQTFFEYTLGHPHSKLVNRAPNGLERVFDQKVEDGRTVTLWGNCCNDNQKWWMGIVDNIPNAYKIVNLQSGNCVTDVGAGRPLETRPCQPGQPQSWLFDTSPPPAPAPPPPVTPNAPNTPTRAPATAVAPAVPGRTESARTAAPVSPASSGTPPVAPSATSAATGPATTAGGPGRTGIAPWWWVLLAGILLAGGMLAPPICRRLWARRGPKSPPAPVTPLAPPANDATTVVRPVGEPEPMTDIGGRYRLLRRIAAGGMGGVWLGTDLVLERSVAVKLLHAELAGQPGFLARFRSEARIMAGLDHPNVARIHDYGETADGAPYLVMEYVNGSTLGALLDEEPTLDPARTLDLLAQAADALSAAHALGVVHRDVKPANLLLRPDGTLVLTDFGIARGLRADHETTAGAVLGTAAYLAPEQAAGEPVTPAADLYSLGVVGYRCLTGRPPFTADHPVRVALKHIHEPPPPLPATVPEAVRAVIEKAMAKDPALRYDSAQSLAAAARHAQH